MSLIIVNHHKTLYDALFDTCGAIGGCAEGAFRSIANVPQKIVALAQDAYSAVVDRIAGVYNSIIQNQAIPLSPEQEAKAVQQRLYQVYKCKRLMPVIDLLSKGETQIEMLFGRLFLEQIYDKKASDITRRDIRNTVTLIHPDKSSHRKATQLFQLHQRFLESADLENTNGRAGIFLGFCHFCFGWLLHKMLSPN